MTRINNRSKESIRLAKVKKAYGIKGELFILPFTPKAKWIYNLSRFTLIKDEKMNTMMHYNPSQPVLDIKTGSSTFNIEYFKTHKEGYIVKFQGCNDRSEAENWCGAFVSAPLSSFTSQPGEEIYLIELKDFIVVNSDQQIGPIVSFSSNGYQDLIQVKKDGYLYDIPFVKELLVKIDWQSKYVHMDLPEGLFSNKITCKSIKKSLFSKNKSLENRKKANLFAT